MMEETCYDIFSELDLPFETYLSKYVNHQKAIHEEMEIIWLMKGKATLKVDDTTFKMHPHTVFLVYMYKEHSIESDPDSIIVTYRLKKEYLHRNNYFFEKINFKPRVYSFEELAYKYKQVPLLVVQLIKLLVSDEPSDLIRYKIIGYYNMYVLGLYRILLKEKYLDVKNINYDQYLNRIHLVVEYTYDHFQEKVTMNQLSSLTGISEYRLSHFIKDVLGISYSDFLQNVRFEYALKQLKRTDKSVQEIVFESGFSDHKYLSRLMKKKFNTTALQYRKSYLEHTPCRSINDSSDAFINELKFCLHHLDNDSRFKHLFGMNQL